MPVSSWSSTASSNTSILSGITLDGGTMTPSQVDDAFREMAAQIADQLGKLGFKGSDIASATTTNLANATGWYLDITGTTTITGLGTVDAGQMFMLRFAGALTFTHNSTSLILPGAANITTAAGDVAVMVSLGSGNWRCVAYQRASGVPVAGLPTSSVDNTVPRFNGTAGALQTSGVVIDDSNNLTISSTDAGSTEGPTFTIHRNSASPAASDTLGSILFDGEDSGGTQTTFAKIYAFLSDPTNGSEDGSLILQRVVAGTLTTGIVINADGVSINGDLEASGDVTAFSDERLKTDWSDLPSDLVSLLAQVRAGTYTRTDTGQRQIGVSAQSLQPVMPEAVRENADGTLSVAYGQAALAACVALAREVQALREALK